MFFDKMLFVINIFNINILFLDKSSHGRKIWRVRIEMMELPMIQAWKVLSQCMKVNLMQRYSRSKL